MKKTAFITGAGSGIGRALAFELAKNNFNLALFGRDIEKLSMVGDELKIAYPKQIFEIACLDLCDAGSLAKIFEKCLEKLGRMDIFFANAGVNFPEKIGRGDWKNSKKIVETNLIGSIASIDWAVSYFLKKGTGHIVGIGSIAAFRGLPGAPSYSASKAGLLTYLEAVRAELYGKEIDVTILNPGYVNTDMNKQEKRRPFLISPEKSAQIIFRLVKRKVKSSIIPFFPWVPVSFLIRIIPVGIIARISRK